jgi:BCD family chlorophyll transporter-like MFS transporter
MNAPATGYSAVYNLEILLLFATLVAIGPLVRTVTTQPNGAGRRTSIGLADFPT